MLMIHSMATLARLFVLVLNIRRGKNIIRKNIIINQCIRTPNQNGSSSILQMAYEKISVGYN